MADTPQGVTLTPITPQGASNANASPNSAPNASAPANGPVTLTPLTPDNASDFSNTQNQSQSQTEQPEGFWSRAYQSSGAKGLVDLGKAEAMRPIDLYHQAVDSFNKGDWKNGTETALKLVHILPDKDDPLNQAAQQLIMQPIKEVEAGYKQNREAGMGKVQAAITPSGASDKTGEHLQTNLASKNYPAAAGDLISDAGGSHMVGSVPLLGPMVQQISNLLGKDIKDQNWKAAAGDVLGPLMTMGASKLLGAAASGSAAPVADVTENTLRPGVTDIAGVKVPVSTQSVADPSALSNLVSKGATATGAQKFIENYTQPAAIKANVANMGDAAMSSMDEMRTVRGEPLTAQNPPTFSSVDDIASGLQKDAKPTYTKLDQAAKPDIDSWNNAKAAWDRNNPKPTPPAQGPTPYTGTKPTATENAVQKAAFKAKVQDWQNAEADWLDDNPKPKTFTELQDQISNAEQTRDSKFASQVDKEAAIKNLPQYRNDMDAFMAKHGNVVDPNELQTADKLWAQSKQFEWLADRVRNATTGTSGTSSVLKRQPLKLDEGALKKLPSQFDTKFGDGAWEKTLGPDGMKNYNDILNAIRNPISGQVPFDIFVREHVAGALIKGGTLLGPITNNLLFNPEFGQTVLNLWHRAAKEASVAAKTAPVTLATTPVTPNPTAIKQSVYKGAQSLAGPNQ